MHLLSRKYDESLLRGKKQNDWVPFVYFSHWGLIRAATWQNQQNECASSEDSDQPGHTPSLIRVFAVRMKKAWVLCYPLSAQQRLWSDWTDAQADLSLRWTHSHFVGFVMSRLQWLSFLLSIILVSEVWFAFASYTKHCWYTAPNLLNIKTLNLSREVTGRPAKTQVSLGIQSDQSLRCPHEESLGP